MNDIFASINYNHAIGIGIFVVFVILGLVMAIDIGFTRRPRLW